MLAFYKDSNMNVHHCDSLTTYNDGSILTAVCTFRQTNATCWSVGDKDGSLRFSACESWMKMINITCCRAQWGTSESCLCGLIYCRKYFWCYIKQKIKENRKRLRFRLAIFSTPIVFTNATSESKYCERK
jgi:hypothetical protein